MNINDKEGTIGMHNQNVDTDKEDTISVHNEGKISVHNQKVDKDKEATISVHNQKVDKDKKATIGVHNQNVDTEKEGTIGVHNQNVDQDKEGTIGVHQNVDTDKEGTIGVDNQKVDTAIRLNNLESQEPRKGKSRSWSEDEHKSFLDGLHALGKNDWKGIHTKYVPSRTPAQIASHAQKYFKRLSINKTNQRTSVFDLPHPHLHRMRSTSASQPHSQVNIGPGINENETESSSKKPEKLIPAYCWISEDDYSKERRDVHGFVVEPLPALPPTDKNPESLREIVLHKTNFDMNLKTALPNPDANSDVIKN